MERKTGLAGDGVNNANVARPSTITSTSPTGTNATMPAKAKTTMAHFQGDGQTTQEDQEIPIPSPEIPSRAFGTPGFRDEVELENMTPSGVSSPGSISSGSVRMITPQTTRISTRSSASMEPSGPFAPVIRFWRRNVVLSVAQKQCRDHFALERTYLAYFRTALNFAMLGVFIAQLFSLQHMMSHDPGFGFFRVGLPLSCACYAVSIVVSLIGAYRFWRQQQAMANSKVHAGGWELNVVGLFTAATVIVLFVLVVIITARKG